MINRKGFMQCLTLGSACGRRALSTAVEGSLDDKEKGGGWDGEETVSRGYLAPSALTHISE